MNPPALNVVIEFAQSLDIHVFKVDWFGHGSKNYPWIYNADAVIEQTSEGDYQPTFNALDISEFKHFRINHSELFAQKHNHINGIESFWNPQKTLEKVLRYTKRTFQSLLERI